MEQELQETYGPDIKIVKQLNPCEAITITFGRNLSYARRLREDSSIGLESRPIFVRHYVVKLAHGTIDGIMPHLVKIGLHGYERTKGQDTVVGLTCHTVVERYAVDGENTTAPTEEDIEAIPGVLKCIQDVCRRSPETGFVYQNGELRCNYNEKP